VNYDRNKKGAFLMKHRVYVRVYR